jgi:hypothetical protein
MTTIMTTIMYSVIPGRAKREPESILTAVKEYR